MVFSDDEEELESAPKYVDNYFFEDADEISASFAVLPVIFDGGSNEPENVDRELSLRGTSDGGLQKVYEQVVAWKLGFESDEPEVSVLTKEKRWICLKKPWKRYLEETLRTTMITIPMLHFLRRNPDAMEKSAWDHVQKVFSILEVRPSEGDLRGHASLIKLFSEKDKVLGKSQVLLGFLNEKLEDRSPEDIPGVKHKFIVEDDEVDGGADEGGDSDDEKLFDADSVCAICDNGGDLLSCEGKCLRSFHPTRDDGEESDCRSLGLTRATVKAIVNFYCENCKHQQHQCFACGKLGSSDKSKGAEVFRCIIATCGHFYHPKCIAELLIPDSTAAASEYQKKIFDGESFICPAHSCIVCKEGENKDVTELQFAMCRRCPRSYHRKCLPRKILFEDNEEEGIVQRAWDGLLPDRILIYCLKHHIDEDLGTPRRNHIKFPDVPEKKTASEVQKKKIKVLVKKKTHPSGELLHGETVCKPVLKKIPSFEESKFPGKAEGSIAQQVSGSLKKTKSFKSDPRSELIKDVRFGGRNSAPARTGVKEEATVTPPSAKQTAKLGKSSFPPIDTETEKRIKALISKNEDPLTVKDIIKKSMIPSTHAYGERHVDKTITGGKIETSIVAVQTAVRKLEAGCSIDDAKAVCGPNIVRQLFKWNNKLKVYLAPFLHGMRYTSFGRHFTKVEKLNEIVDALQWYVQEDDTIVDFCCGANDFSQMMKEKLDLAGKKCNFRNYDIVQPKNDFNFEKRDWMEVRPKELPPGSKLIMGLNPPFGVKAGLANKFIDKALTFKPKLLILIVPKETERLDKKDPPYDLIWENDQTLSGKSFYLPGSVDVNDKQMEQWNLSPPLLYLWSRHDWTSKHKDIASRHGHTSKLLEMKELTQEASQSGHLEFHQEEHTELEFENTDYSVEGMEADIKVNKVSGSNQDIPNRKFQNMDDNMKGTETCRKDVKRKRSPVDEVRTYKREPQKKGQPMDKTGADCMSDTSISPEQVDSRYKFKSFPSEPRETSVDRVHKRREFDRNSVPYQQQRETSLEEGNTIRGVDNLSNMGRSCAYQVDSLDSPKTRLPRQPVDDAYLRPATSSKYMFGTERSIGIPSDDINEATRRYPIPSATEGMIRHSPHLWQGSETNHQDLGARNLDDHLSTYLRHDDSSRMPYSSGIDGYGRYSDSEIPMQPQGFQGMQGNLGQRNTFSLRGSESMLGGQSGFPPTSYGRSSFDSGTSIMQRYAPNLAETNYVRPGYHIGNNAGDMPPDPRGFASGPSRYPYPGSSAGWLDG